MPPSSALSRSAPGSLRFVLDRTYASIRPEAQLTLLNTDPHAPAQFRAIGAPSNMPAFAEAFQCKGGDAMVRDGEKRVKIW